MASLLATTLLALAAIVSAQTNGTSQITWGSVIFTYHGEKTPAITNGPYNLSPLGANQLLLAGSLVRSRYVDPPSVESQQYTSAPVDGISVQAIDNAQLYVLSTEDEFISGSALAFMQGLYPPRALVIDAESILSNSTVEVYPLNGYQYPNINTVGDLDFNYIWIWGSQECEMYDISNIDVLSSVGYNEQVDEYSDFYQSLDTSIFWNFNPDDISYYNAYLLYEYALYQYNHNSTFYSSISQATMEQLYYLASRAEFLLNSPNTGGTIAGISGQTLASFVLQQFQKIVASQGESDKLTLLFGSYQPMLSFFALSSLSTGPAATLFTNIPQHGSIMVFELFSYQDGNDALNSSSPFPDLSELWVRFLFRNGTDDSQPLISYPLFGRGNSEVEMSWADFHAGMGGFALAGVGDWCDACQSINLFCEAIWATTTTSNSTNTTASNSTTPLTAEFKKTLSPVLGGVIGATVTLAVAILFAAIMGLYGFRLDYHGRQPKGPLNTGEAGGIAVLRRSGSGPGGFKGAEKLASDTDLTLKSGAGASIVRHERVGSWELNESPSSPIQHSSLDKDIESGREVDYSRQSEDGIGNINPFGDPVKPLDQV